MNEINSFNKGSKDTTEPQSEQDEVVLLKLLESSIPDSISLFGSNFFKWQFPEIESIQLPFLGTKIIQGPYSTKTVSLGDRVTVLNGRIGTICDVPENPVIREVFALAKQAMDEFSDITSSNFLSRNNDFNNWSSEKILNMMQETMKL